MASTRLPADTAPRSQQAREPTRFARWRADFRMVTLLLCAAVVPSLAWGAFLVAMASFAGAAVGAGYGDVDALFLARAYLLAGLVVPLAVIVASGVHLRTDLSTRRWRRLRESGEAHHRIMRGPRILTIRKKR